MVGREREIEALARNRRPCVFVHGPGGIGKSVLLGAVAAGAAVLDGREPQAAQAVLERTAPEALVIVDTYEEAPALGPLLRERVAAGGRVVIASRRPPDPAWAALDVFELPLAPLDADGARALIADRGIDPAEGGALLAWAEGHPLSLAVGADAALAGRSLDVAGLERDEVLASVLTRRIARDELDGADHRVLAVAAVARAVDARMLAAVVDGVDGDRAETWLRSLSFAEPLGTRVTLHARMRAALATALAAQDPEEDRAIRLRITDYLYGRIVGGEQRLWGDLVEMISDPAIRWGLAPVRMTHRVTQPRPGDEERIRTLLGADDEAWWLEIRRWMREAPANVAVCLDEHDEISGWGIHLTPGTAPEWAGDDPVVGPWLAHAREVQPDGDVIMLRDGGELPVPDVTPPVSAAVTSGNYHLTLGANLPSVRRGYTRVRAWDGPAVGFLTSVGYERAPELDVDDPERRLLCFTVDWGPGGMFRAARDLVYMTLGATPPADAPAAAGEVVRDALRSFHDPVSLAASPLARRGDVRALLAEAAERAFGDSADERLLRDTILRGYMGAGHSAAIAALHVSRATYFRRLSEASARMAAYLDRP